MPQAYSDRNHLKKSETPPLTSVEVDTPGITLRDGRRINAKAVIVDGALGYGDAKSLALMAGDVADRRSSDTRAGERAYESARDQSDSDPRRRAIQRRNDRIKAKIPAASMSYDEGTGIWQIDYMVEDPITGLLSMKTRYRTDRQVGEMWAQMQG